MDVGVFKVVSELRQDALFLVRVRTEQFVGAVALRFGQVAV